MTEAAAASGRLDKWLWHARFFKTRSLATSRVKAGAVRVNGMVVTKGAASVKPGDVLTFAQGDWVRLIEVSALAERRGPAKEAQTLYIDRSSPRPERPPQSVNPAFEGKGRPTKKDRRMGDLSRRSSLE